MCLEPTIATDEDTGEIRMTACKTCWRAIEKEAMPPWALARVDTGMIPPELPILTELECICLLSPLRAFRYGGNVCYFQVALENYCSFHQGL